MAEPSSSSPSPSSPGNSKGKRTSTTSVKIPVCAWITLIVLGSALLVTMYGETMLLPAIPDIIRDFKISYNTSSWILTAYLISAAVMVPIGGKLSDMYGRKKIVVIIMAVYIIGITLGGFANNIYFLIVTRIIQGVGVSMFPVAFSIIRDKLPPEKLAIGVGIFSAMYAGGSVVGLSVGGTIINNFGWHATFFSIVPISIALWFIIRRVIHDRKLEEEEVEELKGQLMQQTQKSGTTGGVETEFCVACGKVVATVVVPTLDLKGVITLAVAITSFLLTLTSLASYSIQIIGVFAVATIVSLFLFVIVEKRSTSPLINLKLLTNRILLPANIVMMILGITMFMVYQSVPILVRSPEPVGFGGDAVTTANVQLPFMIILLIIAPSSGFIMSRLGNLKPTLAGSIISTIGFFSLFIFHSTQLLVATNLAVIAAGISLTQVGIFDITMKSTPKQFSGVSLGMTVVLNILGSSIGPAIAAIYMQQNQVFVKGIAGAFPTSMAYNLIFLTAAIVSVVSIALVMITKNRMSQIEEKNSSLQ
ncbi:MAG: MFS transporter [Nitrososphaeraceae archaeon]